MIRVSDLSFAYDKVKVLDGISFEIEAGRMVAVLGPNGAGKSTLFKCMLGLLKGYEGEILLDGHDIKALNRKQMARIAAYIPQSETPVFNYTVADTVLMGTTGSLSPLQSPGDEQKETARQAIDSLGISHLSERGIGEISGGERQLAMLARAIAQKAKILIMDEPTANLDYGNQQQVLKQIRRMAKQGYTVLISTHNPEHALQHATDVLAIKDHRVIAQGTAGGILDEKLIRDIYGLDVKIIETEINGRMVRSCVPAAED